MTRVLFAVMLIWNTACSHTQENVNRVALFEVKDRGARAIKWLIPEQRFETMPRWRPLEEDCPLSASKAFRIATEWFKARDMGELRILNISLRHITSDTKWSDRWWYVVEARLPLFETTGCVILLDGTVVEPEKP